MRYIALSEAEEEIPEEVLKNSDHAWQRRRAYGLLLSLEKPFSKKNSALLINKLLSLADGEVELISCWKSPIRNKKGVCSSL